MKYADNVACDILYEDRHLLALLKPADWPTQPTLYSQMDLESYAKHLLQQRLGEGRNPFVHAAHRLDSPVTGIVLFAKSSKALSRIQEAIRTRSTQKCYLAYVDVSPPDQVNVLEHTLVHGDHCAHIVPPSTIGGQHSKLEYRVLGRCGPLFLLAVFPYTGRYHQIRVQLAAIGCPIVGDVKYHGRKWQHPGIALHHATFQCLHPVGGEIVKITAPLPSYWPHRQAAERYVQTIT